MPGRINSRGTPRLKRNKKIIGRTLALLDSNAGHLSQTSKEAEIPIATLSGWRDSYQNDPIVERYRTIKNEELAEKFRVVAAKAIERLNNEISEVSVDKLATTAAICTDKQLLLTGQATAITASRTEQITRAQHTYLLVALPELQQQHPDWSKEQLQTAAVQAFNQWFESLQLNSPVTDIVQ
jgi:hypothetical protein